MISKYLKKLSLALKNIGFNKISEEVEQLNEEYDEPWHEEAVAEFGEEPISEEEYLEKEIAEVEPSRSFGALHYNIMKKEGFSPLAHGGTIDGALIGRGAYGSVYRGSYKGQDAVMKVIANEFNVESSNEIEIWRRLIDISNGMPQDIRRHLPKIYKVGEGEVEHEGIDYFGEPFKYIIDYQFVIMEPLLKLQSGIYRKIQDLYYELGEKTEQELVDDMLADEDLLYIIAKKIVDKYTSEYDLSDNHELLTKINKELLQIKKNQLYNKGSDQQQVRNIAKIILKSLEQHGEVIEPKSKHEDAIYKDIIITIVDMATPSYFPVNGLSAWDMVYDESRGATSYDPGMNYWLQNPETKSFLNLLFYLYSKHNILWADVHEDNIMMGKDGTLKLIDVGLFR